MRYKKCARAAGMPAFTLIEALVVLGIMSILLGLLMPAVQSARETARRVDCQSRMAQVGKALAAHVADHNQFPFPMQRALAAPRWPSVTLDTRYASPFVSLLPNLGAREVFSAFNFDAAPLGPVSLDRHVLPANTTAASVRLAVLICPSDPARNAGPWGQSNFRYSIGPTHFHDFEEGNGPLPFELRQRGAFVTDTILRPADFPDGLSRTAFVSEKLRGNGGVRFNARADFWHSPAYPQSQEALIQACAALYGPPASFCNEAGWSWQLLGQRFTAYNHDLPPNSSTPDCSVAFNDSANASTGCITARSYHAGEGVNVLFGDGHVEFMGRTIAPPVWGAIGTRNSNDVAEP